MNIAKPKPSDIDAAGTVLGILQSVASGWYPAREDEENAPSSFDPDDTKHLRQFYDLVHGTLDASPGWPGRVIGGMCYGVMYPANKIVDPESDFLQLHPELQAAKAAYEGQATKAQGGAVEPTAVGAARTWITAALAQLEGLAFSSEDHRVPAARAALENAFRALSEPVKPAAI